MIKLTKENLTNAIKRARQIRPRVTWLGGRSFAVSGSTGNTYTVHFAVARDAQGKQVCLGVCDCAAGQREMTCFHLAAAASLNLAIHAMRQAVKAEEPKATTDTRNTCTECGNSWTANYQATLCPVHEYPKLYPIHNARMNAAHEANIMSSQASPKDYGLTLGAMQI